MRRTNGDSFYEYLLKMYVLWGDVGYWDMFMQVYTSVQVKKDYSRISESVSERRETDTGSQTDRQTDRQIGGEGGRERERKRAGLATRFVTQEKGLEILWPTMYKLVEIPCECSSGDPRSKSPCPTRKRVCLPSALSKYYTKS